MMMFRNGYIHRCHFYGGRAHLLQHPLHRQNLQGTGDTVGYHQRYTLVSIVCDDVVVDVVAADTVEASSPPPC